MKTYHLSPTELGWKLTLEGFDDPVETYPDHTKADALSRSIDIITSTSAAASLRIHRTDGTFEEERTYPRAADPVASVG
ncbi:hypothetical protein SAMN02745166_02195 [Prosthecobacter debontii]|uniref:DUF2188 domain-containing protein n=1 Tax=Prosthecobacter debontii TaxID=48467 RepID=A0A1T4XYR2_9BACT|nr:DUF2188 domain-containing protein [Prosthecobacter debontii]SKA94694.1 hypothetical protein SAMN02745166_02195 [Prosthecobacter debontii]